MITDRDKFIKKMQSYSINVDSLKIKDIKPIDCVGKNLLNSSNFEDIIDNIVELPLREACKIFRRKGIETVMSSANKNNVLKNGQKPLERENVSGNSNYIFMPKSRYIPRYDGTDIIYGPTFEDAGKGYAWIMLNYETLSDENKDLLFELEDEKHENGENIGQKRVWFIEPGGLSLDFNKMDESTDVRDVRFKDKSIVLSYNDRYPKKVVILRFPVNENTTVKEIIEYFKKIAEKFREQTKKEKIQVDTEKMK